MPLARSLQRSWEELTRLLLETLSKFVRLRHRCNRAMPSRLYGWAIRCIVPCLYHTTSCAFCQVVRRLAMRWWCQCDTKPWQAAPSVVEWKYEHVLELPRELLLFLVFSEWAALHCSCNVSEGKWIGCSISAEVRRVGKYRRGAIRIRYIRRRITSLVLDKNKRPAHYRWALSFV